MRGSINWISTGAGPRLVMFVILLLATPAQAGMLDFFTHGAEVKSAAGAGTTVSRGAPAIFYNPANLMLSRRLEPYFEMSVMSLNYHYQYPGFDPAGISMTTPVPFAGLAWKPNSWLALGAVVLPMPGGLGEMEIANLPTRQMGEEPILVNVTTGGEGFGYMVGVGAAMKPFPNLSIGASVIRDQSAKQTTEIAGAEDGVTIMTMENSSVRNTFILGSRLGLFKKLTLGLSYRLPATVQSQGQSLNEGGESFSSTSKECSRVGFGVEYRMWKLIPFADITYEDHANDAGGGMSMGLDMGEAMSDRYNIMNYVGGLRYRHSSRHMASAAFGLYPSFVGDGIMRERSTDDEEWTGLEFGDIMGIGRMVFSGGYRYGRGEKVYQFGCAYHQGFREVAEHSRGYGTYTFRMMLVSASGVWRF